MRNIIKRTVSSVGALALVANSVVGVLAQDRPQERRQQERKAEPTFVFQSEGKTVTVQSSDGQTSTFNLRVPDPATGVAARGFGGTWVSATGQQGGDGVFQFFSQELSFDSRLVKGAPFSAETVTESVQVLPDGNRIVQKSEGHIYRDGQGRTRHERTFQMGGSAEQRQTINIFDPVANVNYQLDPATRTARKVASFMRTAAPMATATVQAGPAAAAGEVPKKITVSGGVLQGSAIKRVQPPYPPVAKAAGAEGAVQVQVTISETGDVIEASVISGHPLLREAALEAARQWQFKPIELQGKAVKVQGVLTFNFTLQRDDNAARPGIATQGITKLSTNTEQLGKQVLEGVECEGTRAVSTIPAGAIGNERPIETVTENWYSPELRMMIMTKRSDPRFGESTYRVTNLIRSEPDPALFQVPSDYTVKEGGPGVMLRSNLSEQERMQIERKVQAEGQKPNN